ncbi:transcription factor A, mitochondrial [Tribolium castaneum]|uniref:Transcription factor A, mitochondrial-like Protein n=1 Tax=Tribolium castaneum TaxID=7070 RepID=D6WV01_TRICA|nr:PREDICTED: transcription factor A, mitochondrial [Tribolium castaneum]EFA08515.1 Transcription factor A, mitochondrial-like Protein [Tribolium castaneum]|eukprot:XP_974107.1 PREDICTED: transcription factor A, mitochondrial [Tribolium castaneum]
MARLFFSSSLAHCRLLLNNSLQLNQASGVSRKAADKLKELKIPNKPKKPLTPYFKFIQDHRPALLKQNPNLKVTQVVSQLAADWKTVDPSLKAKYENDYKNEMEEYADQYLRYTESLTTEQKMALKEYNKEVKKSKIKREKKKKVRENDKPKKPVGPYMLYLMEQAKVSNKKYPQLMKELKGEWAELSPDEKSKYVEAAEKAKKQYEQDLSKWEMKMIEEGNEDLVRQSTLNPTAPSRKK